MKPDRFGISILEILLHFFFLSLLFAICYSLFAIFNNVMFRKKLDKIFLGISCLILCWANLSHADSLKPEEVPSPLQPWIDWVLHDVDDYTCPFHYNQSPNSSSEMKGICHWPSRLTLNVNTKQAEFNQEWQVYRAGWVALPGNPQNWPQNVQINDTPAVVTDRGGIPSMFAPEGLLKIQGQFHWEQQPEFLQIPHHTGLVALKMDEAQVTLPELDTQGRLWLQRGISDAQKAEENRLDIHVYRLISDDIPLQLVTRIELDVAGNHREVMLGPVMLDKHIAMSLSSALPARLESDGGLRVQVRPGSWTLTLRTRQEGVTSQLTLPSLKEQTEQTEQQDWVNEEIWVFQAHNKLRLVEIRGVTAIDSQQIALPSEWRHLPAYQVRVGDTVELVEKQRGDSKPIPDQLSLKRHFWLDFDGKGYSVQDRVTGTMTRGWRLEMAPPAQLGRVSVNGQDQFITRLTETGNAGVEVRRGQINLVADSRLEKNVTQLPAVGWAHDFQQVSAILHLPPGWRLLNATGVDDVPGMLLKKWDLMNLFIVLIMAVAVGKLWRWRWGILTLFTMILLSHETGAPPYWVWLNIIAALALLRVLPELGWFTRLVRGYRNLSLLALLIIAIPFMMQQARQSIYPQLEYPWERLDSTGFIQKSFKAEADEWKQAQSLRTPKLTITAPVARLMAPPVPEEISSAEKQKQLLQIDPNAQVQTGPGLPQWGWPGSITMHWSGPVQQNQEIELWLLSPTVNSVLGWIRIVLLGILIVFFLWASFGRGARLKKPKPSHPETSLMNGATATVLFGILFALPMFSYAQTSIEPNQELVEHSKEHSAMELLEKSGVADVSLSQDKTKPAIFTDFPPQSLLDELQKRLLAPADCLPYCASSPRLLLELQPTQLRARLEIHSYADIAVPLPGLVEQWLPQKVWLNDEPAQGLLRHNGQLWLNVSKGIHQVQIAGVLPNRAVVQLPLPLKPQFVTVVNTQGWHIEGVHKNGVADDQLQFTRKQTDEMPLADLEMGSLPPFVQVERTLSLGLDWQVETRVIRQTPFGSPIVLKIPLLKGESVTSDTIRVEEGKALINMSSDESEISWSSVFETQETITLTAPANTFSSEIWRLDASAIWHVEIEGIPVVHHQAQGRWLPEWRPWPGETVTLHLSRPKGVTGQILTIDRSQLIVKPGQRTTDYRLFLNIRSSRGMQHKITLPEKAQLKSVKINDQSQPIHQEGPIVTLPITPGAQRVELQFQQPIGMTQHFYTPNVDLGIDSVNTIVEVSMPKERWILFTGGQPIGPAVMIWGILIVIIFVSMVLGQISLTPLNAFHWLLLGIVLSQVPIPLMLCVVAWFMALGWRAKLSTNTLANWKFNFMQLSLGILTLVALMTLIYAIHQGLLGHPNMHIAGNGSHASYLRWYEDRTAGILPQVWVFSLSMWFYRIAMLLWALWLSFALIRWLRWGWECFSTNGLWKPWRS
jgi:hypothetical protein